MPDLPILWSFRRCPYAMRARLGVQASGTPVELREITLKAKPEAFRARSPDGTVPLLDLGHTVIPESLDIMRWALAQNDPEGWLDMPPEGWALIDHIDGPFKRALDRTKYATRYPDSDPAAERAKALAILHDLNPHPNLFGPKPTLADMAILPFVRQFALIDKPRFDRETRPDLQHWLTTFLSSPLFQSIMPKLPPWDPDAARHMPLPNPTLISIG